MKTLYWAPYLPLPEQTSWNLSIQEPKLVLSDIQSFKNKENLTDTWYACSSFLEFSKNLFFMPNPVHTSLVVDETTGIVYQPDETNRMTTAYTRSAMVNDALTISLNYGYIFFSEEEIELTTYPTFLHHNSLLKYGYCTPGTLNTSKWFRPIILELQLWQHNNSLVIDQGSPLFYFKTSETVKLQRFFLTDTLKQYSNGCVNFKALEPKKPLSYLYTKFKNSGLNKQVLKEIKENLVNSNES
jgi:hypothetical protein